MDPRLSAGREFRERMQAGQLQACIIPVAATEQHLEHLAMEHDWRSCMFIAEHVAQRLKPNVIVAPAMNIGISEHHMRHIGTLSALPGRWLAQRLTRGMIIGWPWHWRWSDYGNRV